MAKFKKMTAILLSAIMFVCAFTISASAVDIKTIKSGETYSVSQKKKGWNTYSYKFTTKSEGELKLTITSNVSRTDITVMGTDGKSIKPTDVSNTLGTDKWWNTVEYEQLIWNSTEQKFNGTRTYKVKEGTYYIKVAYYYAGKVSFKATFPSSSSSSSVSTSSGDVSINYFTIPMKVGDTLKLGTVLSDDTDEKVTWKSSKSSVASVSSTGKITAKAEGTAIITATIGSNSMKVQIKVTD